MYPLTLFVLLVAIAALSLRRQARERRGEGEGERRGFEVVVRTKTPPEGGGEEGEA